MARQQSLTVWEPTAGAPLAKAYCTISGLLINQLLSLPNVLLTSTKPLLISSSLVSTLGFSFTLGLLILKMVNLSSHPSFTLIPTKYIFICYHSLRGLPFPLLTFAGRPLCYLFPYLAHILLINFKDMFVYLSLCSFLFPDLPFIQIIPIRVHYQSVIGDTYNRV